MLVMAVIYCIFSFSFVIFVINPVLSRNLPNVPQNSTLNGRIVGGRDAIEGEIPYMASLQFGDDHWCGGSILSSKTIITAAHCVDGTDAAPFKIRYNTLQRSSGGTQVEIARIVVHHKYHPTSFDNDIAIVHLASSLILNQLQSKSVQLPVQNQDPPAGTEVVVSGWGRIEFPSGPLPENLQTVNVSMISRQRCREQFGESSITDNMICAGDRGDKDACQGDSGGPLVHDGVLWGITSWGPNGCAVLDRAGVYTRVGKYVDWIHLNLA